MFPKNKFREQFIGLCIFFGGGDKKRRWGKKLGNILPTVKKRTQLYIKINTLLSLNE